MADRYYNIVLSCGCMISLDAGGCCIPCGEYDNNPDPECKFFEEYLCSPNWVGWEIETMTRNTYEREYTKDEIAEAQAHFQEVYDKRLQEAYATGKLDVLNGVIEWA